MTETQVEYRTTEHAEQAAVFEWALLYQAQYPALGMLYSNQAGAKRSKWEQWHEKTGGMKSGVPDICLPVGSVITENGDCFNALYIEMKRKGGRVSPAQQVWIDWLNKYGNYACVCYSADEAIDKICWYLGIEP